MATAVRAGEATDRPRIRLVTAAAATAALAALAVWGEGWLETPSLQTWSTMFVSVCFQALPFLVLGTVFAAAWSARSPTTSTPLMEPVREHPRHGDRPAR